MKQQYMDELKQLLNQYDMDQSEKDEIINDYQEMYDNYADFGMQEEEIRDKLGKPSDIIFDLTEGYMRKSDIKAKQSNSRNDKIVAIMPFIAVIIFFVTGFVFDGWVYSWLAFLLIPVVAIILNVDKSSETLIALSPFVAVVGYLLLGYLGNYWHPGWLIFLITPVIAIILEHKSGNIITLLTALSPFIALSVFFLYFGERDMYVPGWLVFLAIPALGALHEKNVFRLLVWELFIFGGAAAYIYLGETNGYTELSLLVFAPLVVFGVLQSDIKFFEVPKQYRLVVLTSIAIYVALGLLSPVVGISLWGWAWLVFFAIPVYAIHNEVDDNERIIAYSPFVATFIFFTLGYFFGWWAFSWIAFLLIPMIAIIKEA